MSAQSSPTSVEKEEEKEEMEAEDGNYLSLTFNTKGHPPVDECDDSECMVCGYRDCPFRCPEHYRHDGCPVCTQLVEEQCE